MDEPQPSNFREFDTRFRQNSRRRGAAQKHPETFEIKECAMMLALGRAQRADRRQRTGGLAPPPVKPF